LEAGTQIPSRRRNGRTRQQPAQSCLAIALVVLFGIFPMGLATGIPQIDSLLEDDRPLLIYVYTDWCHICAQQKPTIDRIEEQLGYKVSVLRINADESPEIAAELGVSAYPTIFVIAGRAEDGYVRVGFRGLTDETTLIRCLNYAAMNGTVPEEQSSSCGTSAYDSSGAENCDNAKVACQDRCKESCDRATDFSWRCSVFCCAERLCNVYTPFGPRGLDFCRVPGYVECVAPLLEEYYACLDRCIDSYIAANISERKRLRASCRRGCNEEFYSRLYGQCYQYACPESCKLQGFDDGNFTYWQNSPGSYTGKCLCRSWTVKISIEGPEIIVVTQDGRLLLTPSCQFRPILSGQDVAKVEKLVWFLAVKIGDEWVEASSEETGLHNISIDQEIRKEIYRVAQAYGEGNGSTKTLQMRISAEAHGSDGLLGRSDPHEFLAKTHSGNLTGRVTAFGRPVKHISLILEGSGDEISTTTGSDGSYSIPLRQPGRGGKYALVVRFRYIYDGTTVFSIHYRMSDLVSFTHPFVLDDLEDLDQDLRLAEELTSNGPEWTKTWPGMYLHMTEAVEYYRDILGEDISFQLPLRLYTFLDESNPPRIEGIHIDSDIGVRYVFGGAHSCILVDTEHSLHENPLRPEWEYHEFSHYAMHARYGTAFSFVDPPESPVRSVNHAGYTNPSTQDSLQEGFAIFMSKVISEQYGFWWRRGTNISNPLIQLAVAAEDVTPSLEANFRAWDAYGKGEDLAVASVLWDLYDGEKQYSRQRELNGALWNAYIGLMLDKYDVNGDGILEKAELVVAINTERASTLASCWFYGGQYIDFNMDYELEPDELGLVLTLWPWVGPGGSGLPDDGLAAELLVDNPLLREVSGMSGKAVEVMLSEADTNADGKLDVTEIRELLLNRDIPEVRDILSVFDRDKNGKLNQDETYQWYGSTLPDPNIPDDAKLELGMTGDPTTPMDDDEVDLTIRELWEILKVPRLDFTTVYEDLIKDYPEKRREISDIFVAHGFFADTNQGNGKYDIGDPFRDLDGDGEWEVGEYFVDLPEGGIRYDEGERIGNATNYERPWRRSCTFLPGYFIRVLNEAPFYWVGITYFDNPESYYLLPSRYELALSMNRDGLIYVEIPPYPHNATLTIWPQGVEAETPLEFHSHTFHRLYSQAFRRGYFFEHDFGIRGEIPPPPSKPVNEGIDGRVVSCLILLQVAWLSHRAGVRIRRFSRKSMEVPALPAAPRGGDPTTSRYV